MVHIGKTCNQLVYAYKCVTNSLNLLDTHKFLSCAAVIQLGDNISAVRKLSIIDSQVIHKRGRVSHVNQLMDQEY